MEAIIVGMKQNEFQGDDGPVKNTIYYLNHMGEHVEGYETGRVTWNEIKKGPPPPMHIGEIIEVEQGKYGLKFPMPKLTDMYKFTIEKIGDSAEPEAAEKPNSEEKISDSAASEAAEKLNSNKPKGQSA